jgi:hypothetical protein
VSFFPFDVILAVVDVMARRLRYASECGEVGRGGRVGVLLKHIYWDLFQQYCFSTSLLFVLL